MYTRGGVSEITKGIPSEVLKVALGVCKVQNQEWPVYEISGLRFFADP